MHEQKIKIMVLKLPAQNEDQFENEFTTLKYEASECVETSKLDPQFKLYKCKLREYTGVGYWVGNIDSDVLIGYTAAKEENLNNEIYFEVVRLWVEPKHRGKGFSKELMNLYRNDLPIISDHEGMTEIAYYLFTKIENTEVHFYNSKKQQYVTESELTKYQKFSVYGDAIPIRMVIR